MKSGVIPQPSDGLNRYKSWFEETVTVVPDFSYIGMTAATNLPSIPANTAADVAIGLDYVGGICAIALGVQQLTDKENYRQTQLKIQGLLNILSGIQLFIFSYSGNSVNNVVAGGMTTLAAPAFAFAMLCDVINSAIDFVNADKEAQFEGWLEERVKEVNYIDQRLSGERCETLSADKKTELNEKKATLLDDMQVRCRVNYNSQNRGTIDSTLDKLTNNPIQRDHFYLDRLAADISRDTEIQEKLKHDREEKRNDLIIRTISFVGMTLSAITVFTACPPLAIAATVICSLVAVYQLYQRVLKPGYHRFFAKKEKAEPVSAPTSTTSGDDFESLHKERTESVSGSNDIETLHGANSLMRPSLSGSMSGEL